MRAFAVSALFEAGKEPRTVIGHAESISAIKTGVEGVDFEKNGKQRKTAIFALRPPDPRRMYAASWTGSFSPGSVI